MNMERRRYWWNFIGRHSNVLLLDRTDKVLDCIHRVTTPQRQLMPGRPYTLPPAQKKLAPLNDNTPDYDTAPYPTGTGRPENSGRCWSDGVAGLSPTSAREVAWRAAGSAEASTVDISPPAVVEALQSLWLPVRTGAWTPGVVEEEETMGRICALSPAFSRQICACRDYLCRARTGLCHRAHGVGGTARSLCEPARGGGNDAAAKHVHASNANWQLSPRTNHRPGSLPVSDGMPSGCLPWPARSMLNRKSWKSIWATNYWRSRSIQAIRPLNRPDGFSNGPPNSNVRRYSFLERRAVLEPELDFLDQLALDLKEAVDQPEIAAVRSALEETGVVRTRSSKQDPSANVAAKRGPLRFRRSQGFEILVGRNARQNESVTFKLARADDLWFHARGVPGAHVVIRSAGRTPDVATVRAAAQLAAFHSDARNEARAPVISVLRRQVSRAPGKRLGQVRSAMRT